MMKKFKDKFKRTFIDETDSVVQAMGVNVPSGQYSKGELTICSTKQLEEIVLDNWFWLIDSDSKLIAFTAFGDFFVWSPNANKFYFVNVQDGSKEEICESIDWLFNTFIIADEIREFVLSYKLFDELAKLGQTIEYGSCYILEPWLLLGGKDVIENYNSGSFAIYIDLVGQRHSQMKRSEFSS